LSAPRIIDPNVLLWCHDATDTPLRALPGAFGIQWQSPLDEEGSGTFQIQRDAPEVAVLGEGRVIHVYVDGQDVWQWVIEDINESYGEAAADTITYSGRGTRIVLDRALIYPKGWEQVPTGLDPRNPQYGLSVLANGDFTQDVQGVVAPNWTLPAVANCVVATPDGSGTEKNDQGDVVGRALQAVASAPLPDGTVVAYQAGFFNHDQSRPRNGEDTTWRVAAAVRVTNVVGGSYGAQVRLRWFDHQQIELGSAIDGVLTTDNWNGIDLTAVVPDAATNYRVELLARGQATFTFDLVRLQAAYVDALPQYPRQAQGPQVDKENLLHNGDFSADLNYWQIVTVAHTYVGWTGDETRPDQSGIVGHLLIVDRTDPAGDGLVCYQEVPTRFGQTYWGSIWLAAGVKYPEYPTPYRSGSDAPGDRTWVVFHWLDDHGATVGQDEVVANVGAGWQQVEFPATYAPAGATRLRLELWAPHDYNAPYWAGVVLKEGVPDLPEDKIPGVWRAFRRTRIPKIIETVVRETRERIDAETPGGWPVYTGTLEYDNDYDVVDGVLIPKDERTRTYRFDNVGQALTALALDSDGRGGRAGDLVVRPGRGFFNIDGRAPLPPDGAEPPGFYVDFFRQLGRDLSNRVIFREGVDVQVVPKQHTSREVRSHLIVEGQGEGINAIAVQVEDRDLVAQYGRREGFLDRKSVPHLLDLHKDGEAALADLARQATKINVTVTTEAWIPYKDYRLGDFVGLDVPHLGLFGRYRIVGITAQPDQNNGLQQVALDIDSAGYDEFVQVAKAQSATAVALSAAQRFPQGQVSLYQVNGADSLDAQHPFELVFFTPSTPLYTNQVRLAFQARPFRSYVRVAQATVQTAASAGVTIQAPATLPSGTTGPGGGGSATAVDGTGAVRQSIVGDHTHPYKELPHTHPLPPHTHSVTVPTIEYGIFEGDTPKSLRVAVNGVALEPSTFGYADTGGANIEIGKFIRKGWNTVTFSAGSLGQVTAQVIVQAYINAAIDSL
jgi:hypothetical protein